MTHHMLTDAVGLADGDVDSDDDSKASNCTNAAASELTVEFVNRRRLSTAAAAEATAATGAVSVTMATTVSYTVEVDEKVGEGASAGSLPVTVIKMMLVTVLVLMGTTDDMIEVGMDWER